MILRIIALPLWLFSITCFAGDTCDTNQDGILSGSEQYLCQHPETESIGKNVHDAQPLSNSVTIERDANGKIKRSETVKNDFKELNPCPPNESCDEQPKYKTGTVFYDSEKDTNRITDYPSSSNGGYSSSNSGEIHTGSRGGQYRITSGGNKSYI